MSLLTIAQAVANAVPLATPTVLVGSSDQNAKLILAMAQRAGKSLAGRIADGWLAMVAEHTVTTVSGQADYDLPADFKRLVDGTLWDRSRYWEMRGPLSPQQWQRYKSSAIGQAAIQRRWRIRSVAGTPKFSIDPTPSDDGATLVFEYVSTGWCQSAAGTRQAAWAADGDTGILDEYLLELETTWRVLERLGLAYAEAQDEAEREIRKAIARDGGGPVLSLNAPPAGPGNPFDGVPEGGWGA